MISKIIYKRFDIKKLVAILFVFSFLDKRDYFIVKNFWPHRPNAKGFSIQNLARKYRSKISSVSSNKIKDQFQDDKNLISMKEGVKKISIDDLYIKKMHWANRDFSEYKKAA